MLRWRWGWLSCLGVAVLTTACGGSASESPWPVEPTEPEPGPLGEEPQGDNEIDVRKLPNEYDRRRKEREGKEPPRKVQPDEEEPPENEAEDPEGDPEEDEP
jgi:hypothetical protein